MSNKTTIIVNGRSMTLREVRALARPIVARMYGPGYRVGLSLEVNRRAFHCTTYPEAVRVTVRGPDGRLSGPLEFRPYRDC